MFCLDILNFSFHWIFHDLIGSYPWGLLATLGLELIFQVALQRVNNKKKYGFSDEIIEEEYLKCLPALILFLGKRISGKTTFQKLRCRLLFFEAEGKKRSTESFHILQAWFISCLTICLTLLIIKHVVGNSGFFTLATEPSNCSVAPFKLPLINFILPNFVNVNLIFYTFTM